MKYGWRVVCCVAFAGLATSASADDRGAARAIVDKAIKAVGGAEKLEKLRAATYHTRGTLHAMDAAVPFTSEQVSQYPDQERVQIESELAGMKFKFVSVLNRDKGWIQLGGETREMEREKLAEAKEAMYTQELVARLLPLRSADVTLSPLGAAQVAGRPAVGLKVTSKGHRDVNIYFDKESAWPLKAEFAAKDESGKEVNQEVLYSDYRDVDGVKVPGRYVIKRGGKVFLESEVSDYKLEERVDEGRFEKP